MLIANNPKITFIIKLGMPKMFVKILDNKLKGAVIILIISVAMEKIPEASSISSTSPLSNLYL